MIVAEQLEGNNETAALQWLKLRQLGSTDVAKIGPTTYDEIVERESSARVLLSTLKSCSTALTA